MGVGGQGVQGDKVCGRAQGMWESSVCGGKVCSKISVVMYDLRGMYCRGSSRADAASPRTERHLGRWWSLPCLCPWASHWQPAGKYNHTTKPGAVSEFCSGHNVVRFRVSCAQYYNSSKRLITHESCNGKHAETSHAADIAKQKRQGAG